MISRLSGGVLKAPKGLVGTACRSLSAEAGAMAQKDRQRLKHKVPQKRASSLLSVLRTEEYDKLKKGRAWAEIKAGDAIQVDHLPNMSSKVSL